MFMNYYSGLINMCLYNLDHFSYFYNAITNILPITDQVTDIVRVITFCVHVKG